MSRVKLPAPLTETMWVEFDGSIEQVGYTASQMESYAAAKVREALEAAYQAAFNAWEQGKEVAVAPDSILGVLSLMIPPTPGETK